MLVLQAFYFALPIYFANMAPVFVASLSILGKPIDGGRLYHGQPLFGSHKTWRGFIAGILFAIFTVFLQSLAAERGMLSSVALVDYTRISWVLLGVLMGLGALGGDLLKSFFKRRLSRPSGSSWVPFDQLDFVLGGLALTALYVWPGWDVALFLIIATPLLHYLMNRLAFFCGLKQVPW